MCRAESTVVILRIFIMLFLVSTMIEIVELGRFLIGMYRIMFLKKKACILHVVVN